MDPAALSQTHRLCFETPRPWSAQEFSDLLISKGVQLFGTEQAYLLSRQVADEAEILTLAVDPSLRRQGLASRLLREFEEDMRKVGVSSLFLEVSSENDAAIALYSAAGYLKAGTRKNYYKRPDGKRINAILLQRDISA